MAVEQKIAFTWEDAPADARRPSAKKGGKYGPYADDLRANPGKTAKFGPFPSTEGARTFANQVEKHRKAGFRSGVWEAQIKDTYVWVTYLGDDDPDDTGVDDIGAEADDDEYDDDETDEAQLADA